MHLTAVAAGLVVAGFAATAAAPPVSASPLSYLRALDVMDVPVSDTVRIVQTGWDVCGALDAGYGVGEVGLSLYTDYDVPTMMDAAGIVVAAATQLCPEFSYMVETAAAAPVEGPLKRRLV